MACFKKVDKGVRISFLKSLAISFEGWNSVFIKYPPRPASALIVINGSVENVNARVLKTRQNLGHHLFWLGLSILLARFADSTRSEQDEYQ